MTVRELLGRFIVFLLWAHKFLEEFHVALLSKVKVKKAFELSCGLKEKEATGDVVVGWLDHSVMSVTT